VIKTKDLERRNRLEKILQGNATEAPCYSFENDFNDICIVEKDEPNSW